MRSSIRHAVVFTIALFFALALPAAAQVCGGFTSFTNGAVQFSGTAQFNDQAKVYGAGLAYGGRGAFGQIGIGTTSYDDWDGSSVSVALSVGYQVVAGTRGEFQVCPVASFAHGSGPNNVDYFGDGSIILDLSQSSFEFGFAVGALPGQVASTRLIPAASLSVVNATLHATDNASGQSVSQSETFELVGLGLGVVFNQVVTLRPGVAIPIGLEGASTTFGVIVGINFGRPAR